MYAFDRDRSAMWVPCVWQRKGVSRGWRCAAGRGFVQVWVRGACQAAGAQRAAHPRLVGRLGPHAGLQSQTGHHPSSHFHVALAWLLVRTRFTSNESFPLLTCSVLVQGGIGIHYTSAMTESTHVQFLTVSLLGS